MRGKNACPLRKIITRELLDVPGLQGPTVSLWYEILECGHAVRPRQDYIGETNAYRRRCTQCAVEEFGRKARLRAENKAAAKAFSV